MKVFLSSFFLTCSLLLSAQNKPIVLGETIEISSKELGENRTLNIYLPPSYSDTTHLPVVYLLDGGLDEDFIHVSGLYQFNNFPWVNRVPQSIIVGIVNKDRKKDLSFPTSIAADKETYPTTGGSENFINFIQNELQPFIKNKYHTTDDKTLIGQSLGGLFATEILLKRPSMFNTYILISPSLWWDNGSIMNYESEVYQTGFALPLKIYVGYGKEGMTPGKFPHVMEQDAKRLVANLSKSKNKNLLIVDDYLSKEDHATIGHIAVFNALRTLNPKK